MRKRSASEVFFVRSALDAGGPPDGFASADEARTYDLDPPTLPESVGIREIRRALAEALRDWSADPGSRELKAKPR